MNIDHLLLSIPPLLVYVVVGLVVGVESLGIPLPGEVTLVAAALLSAHHELAVSPLWVAVAGAAGAIIGDSIGYEIGHHYGRRLLVWLRRRFPKHFGAKQIAFAETVFSKHGIWAVFFGRFVALLRIFAGPLSGILRLPYHRFLPANAAGGILWAFGTTFGVYLLGKVAEQWLKTFAWAGLGVFVVAAVLASTVMGRRMHRAVEEHAAAHPERVAAVEAQG
ncbi:DedA family protein [Arsenicicoccus sp. oral taxon 190]|uniref:DedA family protein n=1 Tax=Arsenicicoccus sp. oral taxon 190 TaxID=1658671 RepID=UPI00067A1665|nr:DedA family protein [Arsenicicoccus sp. oral taxon 190]AKT50120.1 membrane protein [Arsenicicoccus sp. oral taxon 190]